MTDYRQQIYDRLATLPYTVYLERVDPVLSDKFPFINVQYGDIDEELFGHDFTFKSFSTVIITVAHNGTSTDTPAKVYTIVEQVKQKLLSDSDWRSNNFEYLKSIRTKFGTMSRNEAAGEGNLTGASITMTFQETVTYEPIIEGTLDFIHVDIDLISPFDSNIASIGPDGRIEATIDFDLTQ